MLTSKLEALAWFFPTTFCKCKEGLVLLRSSVWRSFFLVLPIIWDNSFCGRNMCGARRAVFGVNFFSVFQLSSKQFAQASFLLNWAPRGLVCGPEVVFYCWIFDPHFPWRGLLVIRPILISSVLQETGLVCDGMANLSLHTVSLQFLFIKKYLRHVCFVITTYPSTLRVIFPIVALLSSGKRMFCDSGKCAVCCVGICSI